MRMEIHDAINKKKEKIERRTKKNLKCKSIKKPRKEEGGSSVSLWEDFCDRMP